MKMLRERLHERRRGEGSGLDRLIPPEIRNDRFYRAITRIAALPDVRTILEIGSSSGAGSTEAFVTGMLRNPGAPVLHCIEVSRARHAVLAERYRDCPLVHCHNVSSVPLEQFPSAADVERFHREARSALRRVPLYVVLEWLQQDVDYLAAHGLSSPGIRTIRERYGIDRFDMVLIDGSEFAGPAEMNEVYGARYLLLDDMRTYKNHQNHLRLSRDRSYRRIAGSAWLRNGFAVFERVG